MGRASREAAKRRAERQRHDIEQAAIRGMPDDMRATLQKRLAIKLQGDGLKNGGLPYDPAMAKMRRQFKEPT